MGARSGGVPQPYQGFLERILHALDMTPRDLARALAKGNRAEQVALSKDIAYVIRYPHWELADLDREELWFEIEAYVNEQLGYLLAVKHELNVTLQKQREQRALRQQRQQARPDVLSPSLWPRRRV